MSHVFISYSHADKDKLNLLVEKLKQGGFTDENIWYDKHIKPGGDWRDEIEEKLKEAFAVAVIVTAESMNSTYVTYEWSWALGNGTPVVPLLFEDMFLTKIHSRLSIIHYIDCINNLPDEIIETLKDRQEVPLDIDYLYRLIMEEIALFRVLARVSLWLYPYSVSTIVDPDFCNQLLQRTRDEARDLNSRNLPELLVGKSFGFTSKQINMSRRLLKSILLFWNIFYERSSLFSSNYHLYPLSDEIIEKAEKCRSVEFEVAASFFETDSILDESFKRLDYYLNAISEKRITLSGTIVYPPTGEFLLNAQYDLIRWVDSQGIISSEIIATIETVKKHVLFQNVENNDHD